MIIDPTRSRRSPHRALAAATWGPPRCAPGGRHAAAGVRRQARTAVFPYEEWVIYPEKMC